MTPGNHYIVYLKVYPKNTIYPYPYLEDRNHLKKSDMIAEHILRLSSNFHMLLLLHRSKSNIDLLNMDQNSDTASIHSLPVNSSFPALNAPEEISGLPNKPFDESSTSSPLASPPNGTNGKTESNDSTDLD